MAGSRLASPGGRGRQGRLARLGRGRGATGTLSPIEEGRMLLRAAARSGSVSSSVPPVSPPLSISSLEVSSVFWSAGASEGTRKPERYQREGASGSSSWAKAWSLSGPTRSSLRASTSSERIWGEVISRNREMAAKERRERKETPCFRVSNAWSVQVRSLRRCSGAESFMARTSRSTSVDGFAGCGVAASR